MTPYGYNVYINSNMESISPLRNVLELGIYMSGDCSFNFHIPSLSIKCANLSGCILRIFYTINCITFLTLFKSIVLSRLDYGSQLWSPFLIKHRTQLKKIQRSFTKHITEINDLFREEGKGTALSIFEKLFRDWFITPPTLLLIHFLNIETEYRDWSCVTICVARYSTRSYNSFRWCSTRLFDSLPMHLHSMSTCSVLRFKTQLDNFYLLMMRGGSSLPASIRQQPGWWRL